MGVRAEDVSALLADRAIAERRALGRTADDANVLCHASSLPRLRPGPTIARAVDRRQRNPPFTIVPERRIIEKFGRRMSDDRPPLRPGRWRTQQEECAR